ncbi:MAG TPA: HD domain-containing phosphohydrolase, partial [Candidatus Manganitrophaceae bacterium]
LREGGIYHFIPKPWEDEFFKIEIKRAVEQFELSRKNKALYHRLEEEFIAQVELLASLPQTQESSLIIHSKRVREIAVILVKKAGLKSDALLELEIAARLHDFGNFAVPSSILNKPDRLTPEERRQVEKHSLFPEEQLKGMKQFEGICKVIRHHHEFYNGSGYPDHLQGENIPLSSRILLIAEVYDSLLSDRPFRKAYSASEARAFIERGRGEMFDPTLVDSLLQEIKTG